MDNRQSKSSSVTDAAAAATHWKRKGDRRCCGLEHANQTLWNSATEGDGRCCEDEEGGWREEGHFQINAAVCRSLPSAAAEVVVLQQLQSSVIHCILILMRTWCRRCAVLIQ